MVVKFWKWTTNEKDIFIEVWKSDFGLVVAKKISDKISQVYNDAVFGSVSWSHDEKKVIFIGEKADPTFKSYWEEPKKEEKKEEEKKEEDKKEEEKKEEHFQNEKFEWKDDFGETLIGKKTPAIFVYDLEKNTFEEIWGIDEGHYPTFP